MKQVLTLCCGLVVLGWTPPAQARDAPRYSAEITRTAYGIPHIRAGDEASAAYGVGYAYAQDNMCVLLEEVLTVNGGRALHFGAEASDGPDVDAGWITSSNLHSDFFFRLLNDDASVDSAWRAQSPEIKAILRAYTAGFNRLVRERRRAGTLPRACGSAPWVRDIRPLDMIRLMRRFAAEASIRFQQALVNAAPLAATETAERNTPRSLPVGAGRPGSNAVALGKDMTKNGRGILLANPHFPWFGSVRMYEMHVTVPGEIDVMGVSLSGLPFVSIGFTRDYAWAHTYDTASHYTIYALQRDPSEATAYIVDGRKKQLRRKTVEARIRDDDGNTRTVSHDFWISEFGPVLEIPGELEWNATTAYALRDANAENSRLYEVIRAMNRAQTLTDLEQAITSVLGLPWVNTIAADRHGATLFTNVSAIPNVSDDQLEYCVPERFRPLLDARVYVRFVLDGSRSSCGWQRDTAEVQPGIMPASRLPVLRRSDFVQNSNDSAWLTNPAEPMTGYPAIASGSRYPQNGRTRLGIEQILQHQGRISTKDVQAMVLSNRSYYGPMLLDSLTAVCGEGPQERLAAACDAIRRWDGAAEPDSVAYALAQHWLRELKRHSGIWAVPFDPADPLHTPRGIAVDDPAALRLVRQALLQAAGQLEELGVDLDAPWGDVQVASAAGRFIPIHGGDADDVYNVIDGEYSEGKKVVKTGTSYLSVVTFDETGPVAESVLTYNQSTDPESGHSSDQTPLFAAKKWMRRPFTPEQIRAEAIAEPVVVAE